MWEISVALSFVLSENKNNQANNEAHVDQNAYTKIKKQLEWSWYLLLMEPCMQSLIRTIFSIWLFENSCEDAVGDGWTPIWNESFVSSKGLAGIMRKTC